MRSLIERRTRSAGWARAGRTVAAARTAPPPEKALRVSVMATPGPGGGSMEVNPAGKMTRAIVTLEFLAIIRRPSPAPEAPKCRSLSWLHPLGLDQGSGLRARQHVEQRTRSLLVRRARR